MEMTEARHWAEAHTGRIRTEYHAKLDEICARRLDPDEQHEEVRALRWYLGREQMEALNFHARATVGFEYRVRENRFSLMGIPVYVVNEQDHLALVKT